MVDGTDPIADDEELYRRIPVSQNWYDRAIDAPPSPRAFHPLRHDKTGLSVYRAKDIAIERLVKNDRSARFYVAVLRAGDLRRYGIEVVPKPDPADRPGHAELPGLRYDNRRQIAERKLRLAQELCLRVEGPFPPDDCERVTNG